MGDKGPGGRRRRAWLRAGTLVFLLAAMLVAFAEAWPADVRLVRVELPGSVSVEIPRSWRVHVLDTGRVLDLGDSPRVDMTTIVPARTGYRVRAVSPQGSTYASTIVALVPGRTLSQRDLEALSENELQEGDLREALVSGFAAGEMGELDWLGARKTRLGGRVAIAADFRRRSTSSPPVHVQVNQIHLGDRVVALVVAYDDEAPAWKPVVARILTSLSIQRKPAAGNHRPGHMR